MAAAMIRQMPMAAAPARIARATFCRSRISFHKSAGVSRERTWKATAKMAMPSSANRRALTSGRSVTPSVCHRLAAAFQPFAPVFETAAAGAGDLQDLRFGLHLADVLPRFGDVEGQVGQQVDFVQHH